VARHGVQTLDGSPFIESPSSTPGLSGHKTCSLLAASTAAQPSRIDESSKPSTCAPRARPKWRLLVRYAPALGVAASLLRDRACWCSTSPPTASTGRHPRHARLVKSASPRRPDRVLSSHDMGVIEEICDDVTIMRYRCGRLSRLIAALRARAPNRAHEIHTTDGRPGGAAGTAAGLEVNRLRQPGVRGRSRRSTHWSPKWVARASRCVRCRAARPAGGAFFMLTEPETRHTHPRRSQPMTLPPPPEHAGRRRRPLAPAGLGAALRWEIVKAAAQVRSRALLGRRPGHPVVVVAVLNGQEQPPSDTIYGKLIHLSGYAMPLLMLAFAAHGLPLLAASSPGDIFAAEDQHGTWKDAADPLGQPQPDLLADADRGALTTCSYSPSSPPAPSSPAC